MLIYWLELNWLMRLDTLFSLFFGVESAEFCLVYFFFFLIVVDFKLEANKFASLLLGEDDRYLFDLAEYSARFGELLIDFLAALRYMSGEAGAFSA